MGASSANRGHPLTQNSDQGEIQMASLHSTSAGKRVCLWGKSKYFTYKADMPPAFHLPKASVCSCTVPGFPIAGLSLSVLFIPAYFCQGLSSLLSTSLSHSPCWLLVPILLSCQGHLCLFLFPCPGHSLMQVPFNPSLSCFSRLPFSFCLQHSLSLRR